MKPNPQAVNKPSPHSIMHGLDKPGFSTTVSQNVANIAEVIIAKQRMGPIGVERLHFNPELTRFTDLAM